MALAITNVMIAKAWGNIYAVTAPVREDVVAPNAMERAAKVEVSPIGWGG